MRSTVYVLRALVGASLIVVGSVSLLVLENGLLGVRTDVASMQEDWPDWFVTSVESALLFPIVAAIIGTNIVLLIRRRFRRWAVINSAAVTAVVLGAVVSNLVLALASAELASEVEASSQQALGNDLLASMIAVLTVSSVWIGTRLRPWAAGFVAAEVALSSLGGSISIITLPVDIGVGMLAGALVALVLKTRDRTPTPTQLASALNRAGISVSFVERASVDARGSVPWFVTTTGGDALFVKTLGSDQRASDLLFRLYRVLRLRRAGDHRPFASLRRAVEHEAFLSLIAEAGDVRTPHLVTVAEVGADGMLVGYRRIEGWSLDVMGPNEITDGILAEAWRQVGALRRAGIAHRDLRLANVLVAEDAMTWIIDFGFAELAADDWMLARDTAELLASTAAVVGPERSVAAAMEVVGTRGVAEALPWIQPLALSSATRRQIGSPEACAELRSVAATAVGAREVEYERIERVKAGTVVGLASVVMTMYLLVPQLSAANGLLDELRTAQPGWVIAAVVASAFTYLGAGVGMIGAVPVRLALGLAVLAQLASSFSGRITPAKVGGMPTIVRLLQKQDLSLPMAAGAVGLNTIVGVPVHLALLVLFGVTTSGVIDRASPGPPTAALVGALVLVSGGLMLLPGGQRLLTDHLLPAIRAGLASIGALARRPAKLPALLGGGAIVTSSYVAAMIASLAAFGAAPPLANAAAVYLVGAAVAAVAPTPGGVGATEALLVAGYTAVGVDTAPAVAAVLVFRLVTFWLPIGAGGLALLALRRSGRL